MNTYGAFLGLLDITSPRICIPKTGLANRRDNFHAGRDCKLRRGVNYTCVSRNVSSKRFRRGRLVTPVLIIRGLTLTQRVRGSRRTRVVTVLHPVRFARYRGSYDLSRDGWNTIIYMYPHRLLMTKKGADKSVC